MAKLTRRRMVDDEGVFRLFDERPIEIHGFRFESRSAVLSGGKGRKPPTFDEWLLAVELAAASVEASPYWLGDLLVYAEGRDDWREKMSGALERTGLSRQTMINYSSICRRVETPERKLAESIHHLDVVASLPREEQTKWLESAKVEGWTVRELRQEFRTAKRRKTIAGQAVLEGMYRVALFDCPWPYRDSMASGSSASTAFPTMTIEELCRMGPLVQAHLMPLSVSFFWVPEPLLYMNPGPRDVLEAWGLEHKAGLIWKKRTGFGHYVRTMHEHLLICTRKGKPFTPDRPTPQIDSVFTTSDEIEAHSQKPSEQYTMIERLYDGPYAEFFASTRRDGWSAYGNDARLWAEEAVPA